MRKTRRQLGRNIQRMVHRRGIPDGRFCSYVGCTMETYRRWRAGLNYPGVSMLYAIREVLQCRWADLLGPDD